MGYSMGSGVLGLSLKTLPSFQGIRVQNQSIKSLRLSLKKSIRICLKTSSQAWYMQLLSPKSENITH